MCVRVGAYILCNRDNLGRYSDGSAFCFGCHYVERANVSPFVGERDGKIERDDDRVRFPEDATGDLDHRASEWLHNYSITATEVLRSRIQWSPSWEQPMARCLPYCYPRTNTQCQYGKNW